jgi:hypothetical protein
METSVLIGTIKHWSKEKERYELSKSFDMSKDPQIEFGGIIVSSESNPPIVDSLDKSQSIILRKNEGQKPPINLHLFLQRDYFEKPKRYIVGKTILIKNPSFYFSKLSDLVYLQIYEGNPGKGHPDMLEITPAQRIGESQSSPLL